MLFKCSVCGYIHEGPEAPEKCPKCAAEKDKFTALTEEEAKKVLMSVRTNDIHMEIVRLANKIKKLADEGIEINLDPPCVALFKQASEEATVISRGKAEIVGHSRGSGNI